MAKLTLKTAIKKYEEGHMTLEGVYDACETDLEFYNFLRDQGMDEDEIQEAMCDASGGPDAYHNALALAEMEMLTW